MPEVSLVVVSFHSSSVLRTALRSFATEAAASELDTEVIVVDHSGDEFEHQRLLALRDVTVLRQENRGYAAGLNAGIEAAAGAVLLLANPDLEFQPGSIAALLSALEGGWDVVGPQFELGGALFPAAETQNPREELRRLAARRGKQHHRHALRRHVRASDRLWKSTQPQEMPALSGALLATRRETLIRVGPWDEDFFLYFEEVDWLLRAQAAGCRLALIPAARVSHAWGHAAHPEEQAEEFERSRQRFYAKHYPDWKPVVRRWSPPPEWPALPEPHALPAQGAPLWVVSPSPWGFPAAGLGSLTTDELHTALHRFSKAKSHGGQLFVTAYDPAQDFLFGPWMFSHQAR